MGTVGYVVIAIAIIVVLVALFTISFIAYVKTPAPVGCEAGRGPNCENCEVASCRFYASAEEREMKKRAEENSGEKGK